MPSAFSKEKAGHRGSPLDKALALAWPAGAGNGSPEGFWGWGMALFASLSLCARGALCSPGLCQTGEKGGKKEKILCPAPSAGSLGRSWRFSRLSFQVSVTEEVEAEVGVWDELCLDPLPAPGLITPCSQNCSPCGQRTVEQKKSSERIKQI